MIATMRSYVIKTAALQIFFTKYEKLFEISNTFLSNKVKSLMFYEMDSHLMVVIKTVLTDYLRIADNKFDTILLSARERIQVARDPIELLITSLRNSQKQYNTYNLKKKASIGINITIDKKLNIRIRKLKKVLSESIQAHIVSDAIR